MKEPTIDELTQMYDDYFETDKGKWANDDRNRLAYEAIVSFLPEPTEILDVGCGNGHTLKYFETRKIGAKLAGMDLSNKAITIAQDKLPNAEFYNADLLAFTSRKKWQVIVSLGSIEHLLDPDAGLQKLKSLLRKDGIIYLELPDNLSYSKGEHAYRQLQSGSRQWEWHLDRKEWESKFEAAGLEIVKSYANARPQYRFSWILKAKTEG